MSGDDLIARWNNHLNEYLGEEWTLDEGLVYAPGSPAQEPRPVLNTSDAVSYTGWLYEHGYISDEERRWLLADIVRTRKETPDG
jgi:hypothetical protein